MTARRGYPPFEPDRLPRYSAGVADFLETGLTPDEWRLCRAPRTRNRNRRAVNPYYPLPRRRPTHGSHPRGLDARPYLDGCGKPPRPGPVLRLHDCLAQLGRHQLAEIPVRVTRTKATNVVPLPAGVRGRWEGWAVAVGEAAPSWEHTAVEVPRPGNDKWKGTGRQFMESRVWEHVAERKLVRKAKAKGLTLRRPESEPEPKLPRLCECGCGQQIPASARTDKKTINTAHRMKWMRQRQSAA